MMYWYVGYQWTTIQESSWYSWTKPTINGPPGKDIIFEDFAVLIDTFVSAYNYIKTDNQQKSLLMPFCIVWYGWQVPASDSNRHVQAPNVCLSFGCTSMWQIMNTPYLKGSEGFCKCYWQKLRAKQSHALVKFMYVFCFGSVCSHEEVFV